MNYIPRRTLVTESSLELSSITATLYDLRAFVQDTEDMHDTARVRILDRPQTVGTLHTIHVVQEEKA